MADINYALEDNPLYQSIEQNNDTVDVPSESAEEETEQVTEDVTTEDTTEVEEDVVEDEVTDKPQSPEFIEINGEKVAIEDLKTGYMRQSDYMRKTQEIEAFKKEAQQALELVDYLKKNPHIARRLAEVEDGEEAQAPNAQIPDIANPLMAEINALKKEMYLSKLDATISGLKAKYSDFNEVEVLNKANQMGVADLEFVYHSMRGQSMEDVIKQRVQAELAKHTESLKKSNVVSKTLITKGDKPVQKSGPQLSEAQKVAAQKLGMSEEEYAKWL